MAATDIETADVVRGEQGVTAPRMTTTEIIGRARTALQAGYAASRELGHDDQPRTPLAGPAAARALQTRYFG